MKRNAAVQARNRRGVILAVALFTISLAAIATVVMSRTLLDQQRMQERRRELAKAYYAAEAGVQQVIHWGNYKDDFTPNQGLFNYVPANAGGINDQGFFIIDEGSLEDRFPALAQAIEDGGSMLLDRDDLDEMGALRLVSTHGYPVAYVEELELMPIDEANDPIDVADPPAFKVRSLGVSSKLGIERTVMGYIKLDPALVVKIPAPLVSLKSGTMGGNAKVHWGEAWSKAAFTRLPSGNNITYVNETNGAWDPLARWRTEARITFPNSMHNDLASNQNGNQPGFKGNGPLPAPIPLGGKAPAPNAADGPYTYAFYQNLAPGVLPFPDMVHMDRTANGGAGDNKVYTAFKNYALRKNSYYYTDAEGNLYNKSGQVVELDDFDVGEDRAGAPFDLVFIDTIDKQPPTANRSNISPVALRCSPGTGLKGFFYMCASMTMNGQGNPPGSVVGTNPDGVDRNLGNVWLDGVMFSLGQMDFGGNPVVYGALVAEQGFAGTGTPDIWYNKKLQDGLDLGNGNLQSKMQVVLQDNY